jgi:hypothetical protein
MAEQEQRQQQPQEKNGRGSVSERARRIQRQLQWRRARGADRAFALDVGGHQLEAIQITGGETSGLGTGAIVWDCAVVLSKYTPFIPRICYYLFIYLFDYKRNYSFIRIIHLFILIMYFI